MSRKVGKKESAPHSGETDSANRLKTYGSLFGDLIGENAFTIKETHTFNPGQTIYQQGEPCDTVMFLLDGTVALHHAMTPDASSLLGLREPGQLLGLDGVIESHTHKTSAVALSTCRICCIGIELFNARLDSRPELIRTILKHMGKDLHDATEARVQGVHLHVMARLAHLLLRLRDRHGKGDKHGNIVITIPMSRRDMASAIGTRPESLSRAIRELEKNGVAQFSGKQVIINDLDDLLDASEN